MSAETARQLQLLQELEELKIQNEKMELELEDENIHQMFQHLQHNAHHGLSQHEHGYMIRNIMERCRNRRVLEGHLVGRQMWRRQNQQSQRSRMFRQLLLHPEEMRRANSQDAGEGASQGPSSSSGGGGSVL